MKTVCLLSILAAEALAADGTSARQEPVSINVRICNYAAIPGEELRRVQKEVLRSTRRRRRLHSFRGMFASRSGFGTSTRKITPSLQPMEVTIRLRPGLPPRELVSSGMVFGFAFLPGDGGPGTLADVYAGGAEVLAKGLPRARAAHAGRAHVTRDRPPSAGRQRAFGGGSHAFSMGDGREGQSRAGQPAISGRGRKENARQLPHPPGPAHQVAHAASGLSTRYLSHRLPGRSRNSANQFRTTRIWVWVGSSGTASRNRCPSGDGSKTRLAPSGAAQVT